MPHAALQSLFDGLYTKGLQCYWRADFVNELSDEAIAKHARVGAEAPVDALDDAHVPDRRRGARRRLDATAFSATATRRFAEVIFAVDPDPANAGAMRDWCVGYYDATHPYSAGGAYVNFMMDEGQERVKATYRGNYERLARVKAQYDPDNVFRVNQNITPAAG